MKTAILSLSCLTLAAGFSTANAASIQIGDYTADTENAATSATATSGSVELFDKFGTGVDSLDAAIGGSLLDGVRCADSGGGCSFSIGFDAGVVNTFGEDIVLAGLGVSASSAEEFDLEINGVVHSNLALVATGDLLGAAPLKVLGIDLSDFGVAIGDVISSITFIVRMGGNSEELTYVGALDQGSVNSVALLQTNEVVVTPIPAAIWLFGTAALGGGFLSRKKRKAA